MQNLRVARIRSVFETGELDTIRDEDTLLGIGAEEHRDDAGVEMVPVGDNAEVGGLRRCYEACQPGVPVVEGWHGVEGVGEACCACFEGRQTGVVGGVGVAEGDFDVFVREVFDQGWGVFEFWGDCDKFEGF